MLVTMNKSRARIQLKVVYRDFPGGPVVKTLPSWIKPMQEARVLSRELRYHMLHSAAKKKKMSAKSFNINIVRTDSKI